MKTIHKWVLEVKDWQIIAIDGGATVLSVQEQNGRICLWAIVDPSAPKADVGVRVIGTGNLIQPSLIDRIKHVGSVQLVGGAMVFHVFIQEI